jgi:hypothetical protein
MSLIQAPLSRKALVDTREEWRVHRSPSVRRACWCGAALTLFWATGVGLVTLAAQGPPGYDQLRPLEEYFPGRPYVNQPARDPARPGSG